MILTHFTCNKCHQHLPIEEKETNKTEYVCKSCRRVVNNAASYKSRRGVYGTLRCITYRLQSLRQAAKIKGHCSPNFTAKEIVNTYTSICGICKVDVGLLGIRVDHCHRTGDFRGWLCHTCNTSLGVLENDDFVLAAQEYLGKSVSVKVSDDEQSVTVTVH